MANKSEKKNYEIYTVTRSNKKGQLVESKKNILQSDDQREIDEAIKGLMEKSTPEFIVVNNIDKKSKKYRKKNYQKNYRISSI